MITVKELPVVKPFAEAIEFQRQRIPMTRDEFDRLKNEAKFRAFTMAGLAKRAHVAEAAKLAREWTENGLTKNDAVRQLGELLAANGGTLLSERRRGLVFQNNNAVAYSSGRYAQLTDPDVVANRPYLRYPLGPNDSRTTPVCKKLQGFVARHDHPVWQHIFPPNHHGERHVKVTTLTEDQARAAGIYEGLDEDLYPFVEGQRILPDPGWDFSPGLVHADDRALAEAARAIGAEVPMKTAADYGLGSLDEIAAAAELPVAPPLGAPIVDILDDAEYDAAWQRFQEAVGMAADATSTFVLDYAGEGVMVTRSTFEHIVGLDRPEDRDRKKDRSRFFSWLVPALESPTEVWMVARERDGKLAWGKRYITLFRSRSGDAKRLLTIVEESPEGWIFRTSFRAENQDLDTTARNGLLIYSRPAKRKGHVEPQPPHDASPRPLGVTRESGIHINSTARATRQIELAKDEIRNLREVARRRAIGPKPPKGSSQKPIASAKRALNGLVFVSGEGNQQK